MDERVFAALLEAAREARERSYSPYSGYAVGAAVQAASGAIFSGCNVENASFGLTVCAERNAVGAMVAAGQTELTAVVVATRDAGTPCGMCRQVLAEFGSPDVPVACVDETGVVRSFTLEELLPASFRLKRE